MNHFLEGGFMTQGKRDNFPGTWLLYPRYYRGLYIGDVIEQAGNESIDNKHYPISLISVLPVAHPDPEDDGLQEASSRSVRFTVRGPAGAESAEKPEIQNLLSETFATCARIASGLSRPNTYRAPKSSVVHEGTR